MDRTKAYLDIESERSHQAESEDGVTMLQSEISHLNEELHVLRDKLEPVLVPEIPDTAARLETISMGSRFALEVDRVRSTRDFVAELRKRVDL